MPKSSTTSGLTGFSYTNQTPSICTNYGSIVTFQQAGLCTIIAIQFGNQFYAPAGADVFINVNQAPQSITFNPLTSQTVFSSLALNASASSGLAVTLTSSTPTVCTLNGATASLIGAGTCSITASQPGTAAYSAAASITRTFTVNPINTTVVLTSTTVGSYGQPITFTATVLDANSNPATTGPVNFSLFNAATNSATTIGSGTINPATGIATITTSTLPAGADTLLAVYPGTTNYNPSGVSGVFTIATATPTVTWPPLITTTYTGAPLGNTLLNASSLTPGTVAYTAQLLPSGTPFSVTSATVLPAGSYKLTATFTPTDATDFATVTSTRSLTVQNMNVFVANSSGSVTSLFENGTLASSAVTGGGIGAAADASGQVWSIQSSGSGLTTFSDNGSFLASYTGAGTLTAATALAIDGQGTVWITNSGGSLTAVTSTGAAVFTAPIATAAGLSAPASVNVDSAGSLWIANSGNNTITEIIGVASPVTTPTAAAVSSNTLASKP